MMFRRFFVTFRHWHWFTILDNRFGSYTYYIELAVVDSIPRIKRLHTSNKLLHSIF